MLAAKKGDRIRTFQFVVLPFLSYWGRSSR